MTKVIIEEQNLIDIANSIRSKLDTTDTFKPSEMNEAINSIETPNLPEKGIIINEWDSDGYATDIEIVGLTEIPAYYLSIQNYSTNVMSRIRNVKLPDNLTKIGSSVFRSKTIPFTNLPNTINYLGDHVFYLNTELTLDKLPDELTEIGNSCFYGCTKLAIRELPSKLTFFGMSCFENTNISYLDVKSEVLIAVGNASFRGCSKLRTLIFRKTTPPTLNGEQAFYNTPIANGTGFIYVPDESVDAYKSASLWSTFASQIKGISELEG